MTALIRFFTTPAFIATCIVAIWIGFLAGALAFHPIASQTTKIHQFGFFSQYALNLVHQLQQERSASAGFIATNQSEQTSTLLRNQHIGTDKAYQYFKKQWGRFNSSDIGLALTNSLMAAETHLSQLDKIRSQVFKKNAGISLTINAYSQAIGQLNMSISQLETVQLEDPIASRLRESFLGHLKSGELFAREMALSQTIESSSAEGLETIQKKRDRILNLAHSEFQQLMAKTSTEAARWAYIFVISLLVVVIATLCAIAWHKPAALDLSFLIGLLVFNAALIVWTLSTGPFWISKESGPIESLHTIVLAVGWVLFCRETMKHSGSSRMAALVMACLCLLMFFRELDLRVFNAPEWLINITTPGIRKWLSLALIVLASVYAASRYRQIPGLVRSSLTWRAWPFYIWPMLLIAGEKVELVTHETRQDDLPGYWANGQFWEEFLELNAYITVLYAAYIFAEIYRNGGKRHT